MASAPPPVPGDNNYPYNLTYKFNASMAIIVVVLVTTFFFMALFVLYIRRCNSDVATGGAGQQQGNGEWQHQHVHGLDPEVLEKFPIMRYSSVKGLKKGKDSMECAVCLTLFEEDEKLRFLPACSHSFHPECIDMWLKTHSTCPLCRRSLSRDAASGHLQRALAAANLNYNSNSNSNSFSAAAPVIVDDPEEHNSQLGDHQQQVQMQVQQPVQQDEEGSRHRAQIFGALSRNSESFKTAVHEAELRDVRRRLHASSARFSSSRSMRRTNATSSPSPSPNANAVAVPTAIAVMHHSQSLTGLHDREYDERNSPLTWTPYEPPQRQQSPVLTTSPHRVELEIEINDDENRGSVSGSPTSFRKFSMRRSVSDATNIKLWTGESSAAENNSCINGSSSGSALQHNALFSSFARKSLRWLVSPASGVVNSADEENPTLVR